MNRVLKNILITLIIIAVSIISFVGIYVQKGNKMVNVLPEYELGTDLKGARRIELEVNKSTYETKYDENGKEISSSDTTTTAASTEKKNYNEEEAINRDNYYASKDIVIKRLKALGIEKYSISVNEETGKIVIEIPEDENTDEVVGSIYSQGKFEIIDEETKEVLLTNDDIDSVQAGYGSTETGTQVFLNIQFNKAGKSKFRDITNTYVMKEVEVASSETDSESTETKTESVAKNIILKIDHQTILTTYFGGEISNGLLQLTIGGTISTQEDLQDALMSAGDTAVLLNNGCMPIAYQVGQNSYVASYISSQEVLYTVYAIAIMAGILAIVLVVRYGKNGILSVFSLLGYSALLLIIIRYTNIQITIESILTLALSYVINYVFVVMLLNNLKKNSAEVFSKNFSESLKKWTRIMLPVFVVGIVFVLSNSLSVVNIGVVLFWAFTLSYAYNASVTTLLLKDSNK